MDKHWMVLRQSERKPLGEDFSGRIPPPPPQPESLADQWRQRIVQSLEQFAAPINTTSARTKHRVSQDLSQL